IMGLVPATDVPPFGVLENPVPPANVADPLWGGALAGHTFPWFAPQPVTVTATRAVFTGADVVAANGERDPAAGQAQTSWKIGIVLLVSASDAPRDVDAAKAVFDPISEGFASSFHAATDNLGSLDVVTSEGEPGGGGAGGGGAPASVGSGGA